MTSFLRFLSLLIGFAGAVSGIYLLVQAQPSGTMGQVNTLLVMYGIAALMSGLFWAALGLTVAKGVDLLKSLRDGQSSSRTEVGASEGPESRVEAQSDERTGSGHLAGIVIFGTILLVLLAVILAGG